MPPSSPYQPAPKRRRVLGELGQRHLNAPLPFTKRAPITLDQENVDEVNEGLYNGIYDINEIFAVTNGTWLPSPAQSARARRTQEEQSDDEDFPSPVGDGPASDIELPDDDHMGDNDNDIEGEQFHEGIPRAGDEHNVDDHNHEDHADEFGFDEHGERIDPDEDLEETEQLQHSMFDPSAIGLREINNLAHFGVSSHKPGNGVEELLADDLDKYWQSDGQQPHLLTIHFLRRVEIRAIRFYVDYNQDESYTPTNIVWHAGTGHHDLIEFADVKLTNPVGWQDVPIANCGGAPDGHSLCCWIVQAHIKENHQNGKDTHIRGIKIFAIDENTVGGAVAAGGDAIHEMGVRIDEAAERMQVELALANDNSNKAEEQEDYDEASLLELLAHIDREAGSAEVGSRSRYRPGEGGFSDFPDFMRDPVIR
ncbi:anaphase-promoting complex, subunit 10-domain-containing protein [Copromyces sp. CBS 386.78]|nr:anaphase-promoting complex, subunit 10-domain-containing protein [Copromyces sp. CBS 386.78]